MRPIIGITQDIELKPDSGGYWSYLINTYADAVYRFGGTPLMIPIITQPEAAAEYASRVDGLLFAGGDDIHPRYYGEEPGDESGLSPDTRTEFELALLREAFSRGMPVLGICLGIQTMNIYFGGTLHQDIGGHREGGRDISHEINVAAGTRLHGILGTERLTVNSFHHQALKGVGKGLTVSATCADGITEAVELPGPRFVLGVQWHPERLPGDPYTEKLFRAFVGACGS
ncbi:MAG: gamma-glutamyl-gamma-aminobutyrate hydrolase family protein [Nitrospirae bacterium]|nr:gamma-glutamyl-gamma-aminobutyrate hydrolase family protein [Nitrospirota bacterium]